MDSIYSLIERVESGEAQIIISALVLAEIQPRDFYAEHYSEIVEDLFRTGRPHLRVVDVSPPIAQAAARIGGDNREITVPDAIHVATALSDQVDVMLTIDGPRDRARRRSRDLLFYDGKLGRPPLRIEWPERPLDSQLGLPERTT